MNSAIPYNKDRRDGLWHKCAACEELVFKQTLERNLYICTHCNYYFPMPAAARLHTLFDPDSSVDVYPILMDNASLERLDLVTFVSQSDVRDDAHHLIAAGEGTISGYPAILVVVNPYAYPQHIHFVTLLVAIRTALRKALPLITAYPSDVLPKRKSDKPSQSELASTEITYLTIEMDALVQARLPQITLLTDAEATLGFSTRFPLGDLVLAEQNGISQNASDTRMNAASKSLSPAIPASGDVQFDVLIDHYVQRQDLPTMLGKLLAFFAKG